MKASKDVEMKGAMISSSDKVCNFDELKGDFRIRREIGRGKQIKITV